LVSLLTPAPSQATIEKYFPKNLTTDGHGWTRIKAKANH
jgi:hypothetical protein